MGHKGNMRANIAKGVLKMLIVCKSESKQHNYSGEKLMDWQDIDVFRSGNWPCFFRDQILC